jgi:hypothetical protein
MWCCDVSAARACAACVGWEEGRRCAERAECRARRVQWRYEVHAWAPADWKWAEAHRDWVETPGKVVVESDHECCCLLRGYSIRTPEGDSVSYRVRNSCDECCTCFRCNTCRECCLPPTYRYFKDDKVLGVTTQTSACVLCCPRDLLQAPTMRTSHGYDIHPLVRQQEGTTWLQEPTQVCCPGCACSICCFRCVCPCTRCCPTHVDHRFMRATEGPLPERYEEDPQTAFVRTQLSAVPCWYLFGECCGSFPHGIRVPRHLPAVARAAWVADVVRVLESLPYAGESK